MPNSPNAPQLSVERQIWEAENPSSRVSNAIGKVSGRVQAALLARIFSNIGFNEMSVLTIGGGTGYFSRFVEPALIKNGFAGLRITETDIGAQILELRGRGSVEACIADACKLEETLADRKFPVIYAHNLFHTLNHQQMTKAFVSAYRQLGDKGIIVVSSDTGSAKWASQSANFYSAVMHQLADVYSAVPLDMLKCCTPSFIVHAKSSQLPRSNLPSGIIEKGKNVITVSCGFYQQSHEKSVPHNMISVNYSCTIMLVVKGIDANPAVMSGLGNLPEIQRTELIQIPPFDVLNRIRQAALLSS